MGLKEQFSTIYRDNLWQSKESVSGSGSELKATKHLIDKFHYMIHDAFEINSILDIPCGDFNWMKEVNLHGIKYIGADIVEELVEKNNFDYPLNEFHCLDITSDPLPMVDLVFVRDCLGHLTDANIFKALKNIQASGSKYLAVTSFTSQTLNPDIQIDGKWKPINLMTSPYFLRPIYLINEDCQEGYPHYNDKCMIVVDIQKMFIQK